MLPGYMQGVEQAGGAPVMLPMTDDAEALMEKLLSMALPEKERMAERAAMCGGRWTVCFAGCVHSGEMPAVYLDRRFISFCAEIHAATLYDIRIAADYTDDGLEQTV